MAPVFADDAVDYSRQIKPLLQSRCYACHGVLKQESKLRLDTAAFAIEGGENGAAIVVGDAAASSLIKRVSTTDESERMPPEGGGSWRRTRSRAEGARRFGTSRENRR